MFMCSALQVIIKHYTLSGEYDFHIEEFNPISMDKPYDEMKVLHLLWKPGHYDVLYRNDDMLQDEYDFDSAQISGSSFAEVPGTPFFKLSKAEQAIREFWPKNSNMME